MQYLFSIPELSQCTETKSVTCNYLVMQFCCFFGALEATSKKHNIESRIYRSSSLAIVQDLIKSSLFHCFSINGYSESSTFPGSMYVLPYLKFKKIIANGTLIQLIDCTRSLFPTCALFTVQPPKFIFTFTK